MGDWNMRLALSFKSGQQTDETSSGSEEIDVPTLSIQTRSSCEVNFYGRSQVQVGSALTSLFMGDPYPDDPYPDAQSEGADLYLPVDPYPFAYLFDGPLSVPATPLPSVSFSIFFRPIASIRLLLPGNSLRNSIWAS